MRCVLTSIQVFRYGLFRSGALKGLEAMSAADELREEMKRRFKDMEEQVKQMSQERVTCYFSSL